MYTIQYHIIWYFIKMSYNIILYHISHDTILYSIIWYSIVFVSCIAINSYIGLYNTEWNLYIIWLQFFIILSFYHLHCSIQYFKKKLINYYFNMIWYNLTKIVTYRWWLVLVSSVICNNLCLRNAILLSAVFFFL